MTNEASAVVVVTGLSGAGKSTALHALEDLGFFCIDNLPTTLAAQAVALCSRGGVKRVALGIDVRVREFLAGVTTMLDELGGVGGLKMVFLDASDQALLRRFSETRRPHPLQGEADRTSDPGARPGPPESQAPDIGASAVLDGVHLERERLAPLRARADIIIDTTRLSVHDLRRTTIEHFGPASGGAPRMMTRVVSFGFKFGVPVDADLVLDVRFLDNPHFQEELRPLPGTDSRVVSFVLGLAETGAFLEKTLDLLAFTLPKYEREGKSHLTIAIGCTGGRHRSVVVAEEIARRLSAAGAPATVVHRDVTRGQR